MTSFNVSVRAIGCEKSQTHEKNVYRGMYIFVNIFDLWPCMQNCDIYCPTSFILTQGKILRMFVSGHLVF